MNTTTAAHLAAGMTMRYQGASRHVDAVTVTGSLVYIRIRGEAHPIAVKATTKVFAA
jgi:hypothetical protein